MAERFLSARPHGPKQPDNQAHPPPFARKQRLPFRSARSSPGREAAKRTLDGEDRSEIGKAARLSSVAKALIEALEAGSPLPLHRDHGIYIYLYYHRACSSALDALVSNHWGARSDAQPALPDPNMIVQRRSNSHSHVSYFLAILSLPCGHPLDIAVYKAVYYVYTTYKTKKDVHC